MAGAQAVGTRYELYGCSAGGKDDRSDAYHRLRLARIGASMHPNEELAQREIDTWNAVIVMHVRDGQFTEAWFQFGDQYALDEYLNSL